MMLPSTRLPVLARRILAAILGWTMALAAPMAHAWSNHAQGSWPALAAMPEITSRAPVKVEPLESFLSAQGERLVQLLAQEELWAREHVPTYPSLPDELRFRADGASPQQLRERFVAALRLNPESRLTLFRQLPPGQSADGRATLPWQQVTTLKHSDTIKRQVFLALEQGAAVAVIDVLATASDEPDYGLDIGLWEDNGTSYGQRYRMGRQPFGNPALEFASQAPLHMGFFHEASIIYKAAPFLKRTYPEYRVHLFASMARLALQQGHDYWGWRFAGWALHYLQDLTQPYHARVLPGTGVVSMLWINAVDMAGWEGPKKDAITLVSNRHLALENYQLHRLTQATLGKSATQPDPLLMALGDTAGDAVLVYTPGSIRATITHAAVQASDALDDTIGRHLPARYVSDPGYDFGGAETEPDLAALLSGQDTAAARVLDATVAGLLRSFGQHSRAFVRSLLAPAR